MSIALADLSRSQVLFERARRVLPGGVGSNDRALVDPHPIFIDHGAGAYLFDVDGNRYIDYLLGYGPLVLGHAHPAIVAAVTQQLRRGSMYGASHPLEPQVAAALVELIPGIEMIRFSSAGTEAVLAAMRLARAATGRRYIVKFEGQYHGWSDQVALSYAPGPDDAGSITRPRIVPNSEGIPPGIADDTIVMGWNDLAAIEQLFDSIGDEVAGVVTEPICCNFGVIEPQPGYLEGLRALCDRHGSVLVFDEVQTGFRVGLRGAQGLLGVVPDLTCLGKAMSAGFPVSAVGGRADIMSLIGDRRVLQAGTYNTNPLGLAAIAANLEVLGEPGRFEEMARLSRQLRAGIAELVAPIGGYVQGSTTVFGVAFGPGPIRSMREGWRNDPERVMALKRELRLRGVYTKPTPRDIWYVSTEHTDADVETTLEIAAEAVEAARSVPAFA
jgi:glutamate-1-semialdehyde 2,1-aminomutase